MPKKPIEGAPTQLRRGCVASDSPQWAWPKSLCTWRANLENNGGGKESDHEKAEK